MTMCQSWTTFLRCLFAGFNRARIGSVCLSAVLFPSLVCQDAMAGKAEHVVMVVFDGMRPDFVTPQFAPNLYSLATNGVFFRRNHCVFVSTTIVNGAALATGSHPGKNGIIANSDFRPELNSLTSVASEILDTVRRSDLLHQGKYVSVDTVAELIQDAGFHTYIAGTKGVTLMLDRKPRRTDTPAHQKSVTLFRGLTLPRAALEPLVKLNDDKPFPDPFTTPNLASDAWTTKALTKGLWNSGVPKYSVLWLSDPDVTQHAKSVGSPEALTAIENSDKHLGDVIDVLKAKGVYEKTDIFVVSDHGFSSVPRGGDIAAALKKAKINAHSKIENPESGDALVVTLGGAALIYIIDRKEDVIRKTAEVLQSSDFTGVIFSRLDIEGTLPLSVLNYPDGPTAPDFVVSMRWIDDRNEYGAPGLLIATGGTKGTGAHGSLSRFDMNNTLVAAGPDFKRGLLSEIPSGNIDVAPTVLHILGIKPKEKMDGRVLFEGLVNENKPAPKVRERLLEVRRHIGYMHWKQYMKVIEVDGATYYSEGNGGTSNSGN